MLTAKKIKEIILPYFQQNENIISAYLFGSYAKEKQNQKSDIDIAVFIDPVKYDYIDKLELMAAIAHHFKLETDVVILNFASPLLAHQIRKHGILIFDKNPEIRKQIEIKHRKMYSDFLHLHKIYAGGLEKRYGR